MNPNEIRIGSLLRWKNNGQEFDVMMANMADHYFWEHVGHGDIEGIPLTPIILQKCGFERIAGREGWEWKKDYFTIGEVSYYYMVVGDKSHKITTLHQLQNIFSALPGHELYIKP